MVRLMQVRRGTEKASVAQIEIDPFNCDPEIKVRVWVKRVTLCDWTLRDGALAVPEVYPPSRHRTERA